MTQTAFTEEQHQALYPPGIENNFWTLARNQFLFGKIAKLAKENERVLDIGCASGITVGFLRARGLDCFGCELGEAKALPATKEFVFSKTNAFDLPESFRAQITCILLLDVLEHLPDPKSFLEHCRIAFPNLRTIHITLPARMELWSSFDEFNGHYLRYSLTTTAEMLRPLNAKIQMGYIFHILYPMLWLNSFIGRQRANMGHPPKLVFLDKIIAMILLAETFIFPRWLPGTSIWAVAEFETRNA